MDEDDLIEVHWRHCILPSHVEEHCECSSNNDAPAAYWKVMADFCKQCCRKILEMADHSDFAGLVTEQEWLDGIVADVYCEGCGPTSVNHLGECVGCLFEFHPRIDPSRRQ